MRYAKVHQQTRAATYISQIVPGSEGIVQGNLIMRNPASSSRGASNFSRRASSRAPQASAVPECHFKLESENVYVYMPNGTEKLIDAPKADPIPPDWMLPSTKVLPSLIDGYGVFANEDINTGTVVIEYTGKVLTEEQLAEIEKRDKEQGTTHFNIFEAGDYYIDGSVPDPKSKTRCPASYTNHSCFPNTVSKYASYHGKPKLFFVAQQRIRKGDEITLDYKINYEEGKSRIPCNCKSIFCKSWVDYRPDYDSAPDICDEKSLQEVIQTLRKKKRKQIDEREAAETDLHEGKGEDSDEVEENTQKENNRVAQEGED